MKIWTVTLFITAFSIAASHAAPASTPKTPVAPYLLPGAPAFDLTITQFREKFNQDNPKLTLNEFRSVGTPGAKVNLTRAATKINENLYASTALERGTLKIKSIQVTWLPIQGPGQKAAQDKARAYMAALLRAFTPGLTVAQSQESLSKLLSTGKKLGYHTQSEGAVRYVVADNGEKGLTLAVEPIKLALSETLKNNQ